MWEGLFIDITGDTIVNKISLGNIYKPPKNNNNNQNITDFIHEITPIVHVLANENSYAILLGDFNIDLLKVNERELFSNLIDVLCSNGFLPNITVPTRFSTNSCSLIDQIYVKVPIGHNVINSSIAGVIISNLSDHLPCFLSLSILQSKVIPPKFVTVNPYKASDVLNFIVGLENCNLNNILNYDLSTHPNQTYDIINKTLSDVRNKHMSIKIVTFNRYKHKIKVECPTVWSTQRQIRPFLHMY